MKVCFKCGAEKPLTEFYKHKGMSDGHLNKCKQCTRCDTKENREKNIDYYKAYDRNRHWADPSRRAASIEATRLWHRENSERSRELKKNWIKKNPLKRAAHVKVGNALRSGKIKKEPCVMCGDTKVQAHHTDYTKPLDVVWLCQKHHTEVHTSK